ncbi:MAG TPA: NAD(P)-dependent oxidoreductase, partial [Beijerinckiaceae bacterium]
PLLHGKTALICGVGLSSTAVATLLKAFGMRVIGASRTPREIAGFDAIVPTDELARHVGDADYLVNVLPAAPQNRRLIGAEVFAAMKPSARFINVGRGETVDEAALVAALREGRLAGAGLDVFESEPLPAESPLWGMPNVFLTPHVAGLFKEYEEFVLPLIEENMALYLAGRTDEMRNVIPHG